MTIELTDQTGSLFFQSQNTRFISGMTRTLHLKCMYVKNKEDNKKIDQLTYHYGLASVIIFFSRTTKQIFTIVGFCMVRR